MSKRQPEQRDAFGYTDAEREEMCRVFRRAPRADAESFDEFYDDDKREFEPRVPRVDPQTGFLE